MDPIYQTILTLVCMLGAFFWGQHRGVIIGSEVTWNLIIESFDATHIDWDEETNEMVFFNKHDKKFKSTEAFYNSQKREE